MSPTSQTLVHRLVLPTDANHFGTLFAGSLLKYALEAAYICATRFIGPPANLVLHRVLDLRCHEQVPVGRFFEIQASVVQLRRAYIVVGLLGTALRPGGRSWMDGLLGFAQVDGNGQADPLPEDLELAEPELAVWGSLLERLAAVGRVR